MHQISSRREFLRHTALTGAAVAASQAARALRAADSPAQAVSLAVIGTNGRGTALATSFATIGGARIACICDVDERAIDKAVSAIADKQSATPKRETDLRRVLDDPSIDAVVIATPDHWHGPATILACSAGKHVYVEKPASHNPREGELMVAAARKNKRTVQLGSQRRSMPGVVEAIARLKAG